MADASTEISQQRARELSCEWTTDYRQLLSRDDIQAVSICVPNWLHYEVARAAVEAGKAVLCEKPMTTQFEQASELVDLVHRTGAFLQVGYMKRQHPVMQQFREWIPLIGKVETGLLRSYQPFPEDLWTAPGFGFCEEEVGRRSAGAWRQSHV